MLATTCVHAGYLLTTFRLHELAHRSHLLHFGCRIAVETLSDDQFRDYVNNIFLELYEDHRSEGVST